jgi:peroxiredoxin
MHTAWIAAILALASVVGPGTQELHLSVGSTAPAISGKANDGKDVALEALTKKGSVFVVFWKERCPHNPRASALFNAMAKAYGEKAPMIGVVTASEAGAKAWADQFQLTYPLLADTERKWIRGYKLVYSICAFEIGQDGKIAKVFPGYGKDSMTALNAAMAKAAGMDAGGVDLAKAPPNLTWG